MLKKAIIKIVDETNCVVLGVNPSDTDTLTKKFRHRPPGYFFNPKYKLRIWDGYIRFYQQTGKTLVYLLPKILPELKKMGYEIRLIDRRTGIPITPPSITENYFPSDVVDPDSEEPYILRYYQLDALRAVLEDGSGLIIAGTGAGKTIMCAVLCDVHAKCGLKTLTIVPNADLIDQTKEQYEICRLDVGEYSGNIKDIDHEHVVSTWQALQNNPGIMRHFQMVLVDECHGASSVVLNNLLLKHGNNIIHRYGVTATLPKETCDRISIFSSLGDVKYEIPADVLIKEGFLAKPHIDILQLKEDFKSQYDEYVEETSDKSVKYSKFKNEYFPDYMSEKDYLLGNKERNEWIAEYIKLLSERDKGNVFCLVSSKPVGRMLAKLIPEAIFVCGDDKKADRKNVYNLFKDNDNVIVIATVHIAGVGLNIKRIFHMVYIDIGKSFIRVIQTIGRALRKAIDKNTVHITDICSDLKHSKRHLRKRKAYYDEAKYPNKKKLVETK